MTRYSWPVLGALALCLAALLPALTLFPAAVEAQSVGQCPATMPSGATSLVCRCSGSDGSSAVWGTDVYTDDSNLCNAAVHAGAIPATGGIISVSTLGGRESYAGSRRNGIATQNYGRWGRSIAFEGGQSVAKDDAV